MLDSNLDIWPTSGANKNNRNIFEHRRSVTTREIRDSLAIVSPKDASVVHLSCWMIRKKTGSLCRCDIDQIASKEYSEKKATQLFCINISSIWWWQCLQKNTFLYKTKQTWHKNNAKWFRFKPWPFHPLFFRGHLPSERVTFSPSKKSHGFLKHQRLQDGSKTRSANRYGPKIHGFHCFLLPTYKWSYGPLLTTDCWAPLLDVSWSQSLLTTMLSGFFILGS